ALADHAETAAADTRALQVVVRGAGRAFCSGMDRTALAAGSIGEAFYRHWNRALDCLEDMPKITVAVLHGYSIGGGLQLALGCDLRLATEDAVLGLGATRHALVPHAAAPTATAHTKRLLDSSFHRDPRASLEEVLRAQDECAASWEMDEANRAWREKREARFDRPSIGPSRDG